MKFFMRQNPTFLFVLLWVIGIYAGEIVYIGHGGAAKIISLLSFSVLLLINLLIYWYGLTHREHRATLWISVLGLLFSTFAMVMISRAGDITLGLYLALMVEIISILSSPRLVALGILGCIAFSFVSAYLQHKSFVLRFATELLFVGGYSVLYMQQVHANRRAQDLLQRNRDAHARLEMAHTQLADYAVRLEELTLATERQRLARELHDTLSQGLAGMILQLEAARSHLSNEGYQRANEIISQTIERARTALSDARGVLDDLRASETSPSDLVEAIEEEVNRFVSTTDIEYSGDIAVLSTIPRNHCVYVLRVITEGFSNISRHAHARHVWVVAYKNPGTYTIEVRDDGIGFDPELRTGVRGHYGLLGIRERARMASGRLDIVSSPGAGTTLRLCLPTEKEGI